LFGSKRNNGQHEYSQAKPPATAENSLSWDDISKDTGDDGRHASEDSGDGQNLRLVSLNSAKNIPVITEGNAQKEAIPTIISVPIIALAKPLGSPY